jgi:hypothetical protein
MGLELANMMRLAIMAQLYKKKYFIMGFDKKHFYAYSNTVWQFLDSQTLKNFRQLL